MKIGSVSVSFLLGLGTAVSKKTTGLRRGLMHQEHEAECLHHFDSLDVDEDNVLSIEDLEAVIDYMVDEKAVDANEVRTFVHDLSDADYNDDGQIDKQEFMIACEGQDYAAEKKKIQQVKSALKERTTRGEKAKKDLAIKKRAQQHEEAKANKPTMDFMSIRQKFSGTRLANFTQEGDKVNGTRLANFTQEGDKVDGTRLANFTQEGDKVCIVDRCCDYADDYISEADTDGDGSLSFEEEVEYMVVKYGYSEAQAEQMLVGIVGASPGENRTRAEVIAQCDAQLAPSKNVVKKKAARDEAAALKECAGLFERMDIDQDGELSLQDLETVVASKIKNNVDDSQLREFVDAMADLDLNNDEIIDNGEFMSACLNN